MSHVPLDPVDPSARSVRCGTGMFAPPVASAMTQRSDGRPVLAAGPDGRVRGRSARLARMRVRRFELRLIGGALVVALDRRPRSSCCWLSAGRTARRRGRDHDARPARDRRRGARLAAGGPRVAAPTRSWSGWGSARSCSSCPSIGGVVNQLQALGSQTLMPSLEAAYPWLLALAGTSLFAGFGLARRLVAGRRSGRAGSSIGVADRGRRSRSLSARAFAGGAIANELALRDRPCRRRRASARPMPTGEPPACDGAAGRRAERAAHEPPRRRRSTCGRSARSTWPASRDGTDFRWLAYVATDRELGQYGARRLGAVPGRGRPAAAGPAPTPGGGRRDSASTCRCS